MTTTSHMAGATGAVGEVFVTGTAGVATLDPPQLSQTKSEIRAIVAEIAELAASASSCEEFLYGMLPRVCTAMNASAASVWTIDAQQNLELVGQYSLPEVLAEKGSSAAVAHERVLACVAAEGSPAMVPPGSTRVIADRPTNPLDESLLIVPLRIHDRVDTLFEVVHPPGGGPAAQRGYLRFVAQMGDLLAEFLRRLKLRELNQQAEYVTQLEEQLQTVIAAADLPERTHATARALARLLGSDMILLMRRRGRRWSTAAVSELPTFDARSEIVVTAQQVMKHAVLKAGTTNAVHPPLIRLSTAPGLELTTDDQPRFTRLRELMGSDQLCLLPLAGGRTWNTGQPPAGQPQSSRPQSSQPQVTDHKSSASHTGDWQEAEWHAIVALHNSVDVDKLHERASRLAESFGNLLHTLTAPGYLMWWNHRVIGSSANVSRRTGPSVSTMLLRWSARLFIVGLATAAALFPLPDQLRVVAILEAVDRQLYYAPSNATVEKIYVDSHQSIPSGAVLMELVDRDLDARLDQLSSEKSATLTQLEQDRQTLLRGQQLTPNLRDELESRIEQWKIKMHALEEQLDLLQNQSAQLRLVARQDAVVATWDARNRLVGRPVAAGQLLLVTNSPDSRWRLQLSIPERMAGRIDELLQHSSAGLNVQFSFSSQPDDVESGRLTQVSKQLIKDAEGHAHVLGTVVLDRPLKTTPIDGAVARASIDCGQTFAFWLVVRDAYREARSWMRMTF